MKILTEKEAEDILNEMESDYSGKSYEGNWSTFCKIVLKSIDKTYIID